MKYEQLRNVSCTAAQLIPILHSLAQVQEGINDRENITDLAGNVADMSPTLAGNVFF